MGLNARGKTMVAYIIADAEVLDPDRYEEYKKLMPQAMAKHGGRFLARGARAAILEGNWRPNRVTILEFPSLEAARKFYASIEYTAARRARAGAAKMDMVSLEGS
jgi:uncharacterized protein (DUF1330 family)